MKEPKPHIKFILDTLQTIQQFTTTDKNNFLADRNAQDATLMRLQDIGEQLARLRDNFPEFFERNHTDDWYKIIGLQNIISHGYREIEFELIWEIIDSELKNFRESIEKLV